MDPVLAQRAPSSSTASSSSADGDAAAAIVSEATVDSKKARDFALEKTRDFTLENDHFLLRRHLDAVVQSVDKDFEKINR